jgi:predicted transcriptional regulator with HTH domain
MYANTYQKYFHLLVNQLLINGKKIYKLTTLAKKFTRLIRKHDDDTAEDFR